MLQRFSWRSWATVKFWMMRLFEACPSRLAAAVLTDTAEHERTHTDLKKFGTLTNQHEQTATLQVRREGGVGPGMQMMLSRQQCLISALKPLICPPVQVARRSLMAAGTRHLQQEQASSSGRLGVASAAWSCVIRLHGHDLSVNVVGTTALLPPPLSVALDAEPLLLRGLHCWLALCPQLFDSSCLAAAGGKSKSQQPATHQGAPSSGGDGGSWAAG